MVFNKDLPQSSLILDSPVTLSQHLFKNAPRTLFDEMECRKADLQEPSIHHDHPHGPLGKHSNDRVEQFKVESEFSWKSLVRRLREENASLLNTVKLTREDIRQVKYEKAELERTLRLRKQSSDKVINDLQQQLDDEKRLREQVSKRVIELQELDAAQEHLQHLHLEVNTLEQRKEQLLSTANDQRPQTSDLDYDTRHQPFEHPQSHLLDEIEQLKTLLDESERKYEDERRRRLELMFQKRYLLLVNRGFEECESTRAADAPMADFQHHSTTTLSPTSKWRACVTLIIAIHRLRKSLHTT
ncbi:hypothetical protein O0I10_012750 [Lichtheimia ornata]|uniref:Pericentrin/AKAP-450 centrosomal targeting domain-containing protein n=1 Tax=Lichtheimia ornata TaxID=688661 RepID=A0AAD7XVI2_9FUNG|nr:uncharacterized protein O0I10_012750 [Lichtheimia ornata]KAJ8651682.1 hypothetical protein O0I10_012750 [Lichtheimia ornata]